MNKITICKHAETMTCPYQKEIGRFSSAIKELDKFLIYQNHLIHDQSFETTVRISGFISGIQKSIDLLKELNNGAQETQT